MMAMDLFVNSHMAESSMAGEQMLVARVRVDRATRYSGNSIIL